MIYNVTSAKNSTVLRKIVYIPWTKIPLGRLKQRCFQPDTQTLHEIDYKCDEQEFMENYVIEAIDIPKLQSNIKISARSSQKLLDLKIASSV